MGAERACVGYPGVTRRALVLAAIGLDERE